MKRTFLLASVILVAFAFAGSLVMAQSESAKVNEELSVIVSQDLSEGKTLYGDRNYEQALEKFNAVLEKDPNNGEALEFKKLCEYKMDIDKKFNEGAISISAAEREKAESLYAQGKTLYEAKDLEGSLVKLRQAIEVNPLHVPARRYIDYILMLQREMAERDKDLNESQRVLEVKSAWLPPKTTPPAPKSEKKAGDRVKSQQMMEMEEKVNVVVKEINFTEAHLRDVLQYLAKVSGVNIILDEGIFSDASTINLPSEVTARPAAAGEEGEEAAPAAAAITSVPDKITIQLHDIPLAQALKYILRTKGLKFRIDEHAIVVSTPDRIMEQDMETRYYHLTSSLGSKFAEFEESKTMGGRLSGTDEAAAATEGTDLTATDTEGTDETGSSGKITVKEMLSQSGVVFPPASSVFLDPMTSTLIVRNTPDNLALIEEILERIDVPPFQIEIESKFIEINQTALNELGLEWMLKSPITLSKKDGAAETQIDKWNSDEFYGKYPYQNAYSDGTNEYGLTKGVRFWEKSQQIIGNEDVVYANSGAYNNLGNILSLSGILTDPEFRVIVHALDQSGNANQLSAPKVTTLNNQQAQIEVVKEFIYPGSWEVTPPVISDTAFAPAIVTPADFKTRDVGIILNVTPSVGTDRKAINLTLVPEVSEFVDWLDYGSTYIMDTVSGPRESTLIIKMPLFKTKNVTTSVMVNDGDTIVLGGLMSEEIKKIRDKVPLLGDIPILGRLFTNEGESSSKKNLLIFVTARLLDPSGNIIKDIRE